MSNGVKVWDKKKEWKSERNPLKTFSLDLDLRDDRRTWYEEKVKGNQIH